MKQKTIFFGNGLNYMSKNSIGWEDLLNKMMHKNRFELNLLPNIMAYERIRLNWNKNEPKNTIKFEIAELLKEQPTNKFYKKLLNINCSNFVTTNYDYALNKAFIELSIKNKLINNSSEDIYSIRRNTQLLDEKENIIARIWYIHGEINWPKTIMLGLNHYNNSIAKIGAYFKGTYDFRYRGQKSDIKSIELKLKQNEFDNFSWIELFFNSNVHIAGFGFDFSEIDLWWVLTKRARLNEDSLISNDIFYYTKPLNEVKTKDVELEKRKRELLEAFKVEIIEISTKKGYPEYWNTIIDTIKTSS